MNLKKLIAISVVFALVAGAAFAVDLGGTVIGTTDVAGASGGGDPELFNGGMGRVRLEGSGDADIGVGTVGGWVRFEAGKGYGSEANAYGYAWWQPIDALKIQIGGNGGDGFFDTSHIGRYGFYAQANEIGLVNSDGNWGATSYDSAIYGGNGDSAFRLMITPIDALSINVAFPLNAVAAGDTKQPEVVFKNALFQANYAADFGAIHVTYVGQGGGASNLGKIYASAFLSMIENLGLEFGVGLGMADEGPKDPVGIALGATYNAGQFGIKFRGIFEIPMEDDGEVAVRVDLLPYFGVNDNVTIYGDVGIYLTGAEEQFAWHFAPYVRIGAEWGPSFYAGLKLNNGGGEKDADVNWAIPVGIIVSF